MRTKQAVLLFFISILLTLSVLGEYYATHRYSVEAIAPPPIALQKLWGFNWSANLNLTVLNSSKTQREGIEIIVSEISYALLPNTPRCKVYGWLYYRSDLREKSPGILLVHGIGGTHKMFEEEIPLAFLLAKHGYVVLAIDAPGHGRSCVLGSKNWVEASKKLDNITENLFYQVYLGGIRGIEALKRIEIVDPSRIGVLGVSMGGMTAIVVGSIHRGVSISIPIVASGCLVCMFKSGGLANLVGDPSLGLNQALLAKLSLIDPLTYAGLSTKGKKFFFLFSTHDEYFTIEGLKSTVSTLEKRGSNVAVFVAPNNDHYSMYKGWSESLLAFLDHYLASNQTLWDISEMKLSSSFFVAGFPHSINTALRVAVPGTIFVWAPSYVPVIAPIEMIGFTLENGVTHTSVPEHAGLNEGVVLLSLSTIIVAYILVSTRRGIVDKLLALASYIIALLVYMMPYASWPGRFTVTYLELYDRYGVLLSNKIGINLLGLNSFLVFIAPSILITSILYSRKAGVVASWIYAVFQVVPLLFLRGLFAALSERVGYMLPITVFPLELLPLSIAIATTSIMVYTFIKERRMRLVRRAIEEVEEAEEEQEEVEFEEEVE